MDNLKWVPEAYRKLSSLEKHSFLETYKSRDLRYANSPVLHSIMERIFKAEKENQEREVQGMNQDQELDKTIPGKALQEMGQGRPGALQIVEKKEMTLEETMQVAKVLYECRYFKDIQSVSQAAAKILAGRELGLPPMLSLSKVYVVNGRTALEGEIFAGAIKNTHGEWDYKIIRSDDKGCTLQFLYWGKPIDDDLDGKVSFLEEHAKKAGLLGKDNWIKYPTEMYFWRAVTKGSRRYCPHLLHGAYTYDEMGINLNRDGEVIESEGIVIEGDPSTAKPKTEPKETPKETTTKKDETKPKKEVTKPKKEEAEEGEVLTREELVAQLINEFGKEVCKTIAKGIGKKTKEMNDKEFADFVKKVKKND